LRIYLGEIRRYPLLSREDEMDLTIRYRERGDIESADKLINSNLRLVVKIAADFRRCYWMQNLLDLIQEGNVGLMIAAKKFDPYRGYKFSYYASFWINSYIIKFVLDNWKHVKIGTTRAQRKLFFNLRKEKERLEAQGIEASPEMLSRRLGVKESEIVEMDQRLNGEISLDSPLKEDSEDTRKSFLPSDDLPVDDHLAGQEAKAILHDKLMLFKKQLKGMDAAIFDKRLLSEDPMTLQEIGDKFGISRERVRQIESRVKKKLKAYLEKQIADIDLVKESMIEI
jgi:RNA polymerase sigma-32 factor